jgi:heptosyltransferase-2
MESDPSKILIIQTAFIGDVILATSLAESLHKRFPEAAIHFLLRKGNEGLFEGHPFIDKVWIWDKSRKWPSMRGLISAFRREKFDMVINAQRFFSSGLITVMTGARETRGFEKNPVSFAFSKRFPHNIGPNAHEIDRNFRLVDDIPGITLAMPKLYPPAIDLRELGIKGIYVTISPASVWFTKQCPEEKWISLANKLHPGWSIVILGGPSDEKLCTRIFNQIDHPQKVNLAGKLSLLGSAAVIQKAKMNYVNDSAPLHLASATDAPVCAIFCSTLPEFGFGPLSKKSYVMETHLDLPCRPCGLHGKMRCPKGHFNCSEIEIDRLLNIL